MTHKTSIIYWRDKVITGLIFLFSQSICFAFQQLPETATATVPKEIEDPEIIGINKEPSHATLMPYPSINEAIVGKRHASAYCKTLNGNWKFNWADWPQKRPVDFYKPDYDVSAWKDIKVPSNWEIEGYGTPVYSNFNYIFQKDFKGNEHPS